MQEIREGLEEGLNPIWYSNPRFSNYQIREIKDGLRNNINVEWYANENISEKDMKVIKESLKKNIKIDIEWEKELTNIKELDNNNLNLMDKYSNFLYNGSDFYITYYICECGNHLLYKIKTNNIEKTYYKRYEYEIWNIFTCPKCRTFYISQKGKRLAEFSIKSKVYSEKEYNNKIKEVESIIRRNHIEMNRS